jgi:hypothetical protein
VQKNTEKTVKRPTPVKRSQDLINGKNCQKRKNPSNSKNRTTYERNRQTANPVKHGTNLKNGQNRLKKNGN